MLVIAVSLATLGGAETTLPAPLRRQLAKLGLSEAAKSVCPSIDIVSDEAIADADAASALSLLARFGVDLDCRDDRGRTALLHAADADQRRRQVTLRRLLELGVAANAADDEGVTALGVCGHNLFYYYNQDNVAQLLAHGANPNLADNQGRTLLSILVGYFSSRDWEQRHLEYLLRHGADVNTVDVRGWRPIHHAAVRRVGATLSLLLKYGARINQATASGATPLHLVRDGETARLVMDRGGRVNATDAHGHTPLHWYAACTEFAAAAGPQQLHPGKLARRRRAIKALLIRGADPKALNANGETPLDLARRTCVRADWIPLLQRYHPAHRPQRRVH